MSEKNHEVLEAHIKVIEREPKTFQNFGVLKDLAQEVEDVAKNDTIEKPAEKLNLNDEDQRLFFGDEFTDRTEKEEERKEKLSDDKEPHEKEQPEKLIDYDGFDEFMSATSNILMPSQLLMDDNFYNMPTNEDLLGSLVPSQANVESSSLLPKEDLNKNPSKKSNDVSKWFQLFSELDPLNQQKEVQHANDNMHAA